MCVHIRTGKELFCIEYEDIEGDSHCRKKKKMQKQFHLKTVLTLYTVRSLNRVSRFGI